LADRVGSADCRNVPVPNVACPRRASSACAPAVPDAYLHVTEIGGPATVIDADESNFCEQKTGICASITVFGNFVSGNRDFESGKWRSATENGIFESGKCRENWINFLLFPRWSAPKKAMTHAI
jgi:hypothetical protein